MIFPLPFCHPGNQAQKKKPLFPPLHTSNSDCWVHTRWGGNTQTQVRGLQIWVFPSHHIFLSFAFSLYSSVAFWDLANISSVRARLRTLQWISDFCLFWYLRESVCFVWTIQEEINPLSLTGRGKKSPKNGCFWRGPKPELWCTGFPNFLLGVMLTPEDFGASFCSLEEVPLARCACSPSS